MTTSNITKRLYPARSHLEAMRRQITELEFELMGEGVTDTQHYIPNVIRCHKLLGNIVAQADAVGLVVEDFDREPQK